MMAIGKAGMEPGPNTTHLGGMIAPMTTQHITEYSEVTP